MRQPITLKIKFKSSSLDQFIERYSVDVSRGGIFIRTKEPLQVGTTLKFEFQLQDSSALISGEGTVVWIREHDPARSGVAPGMGVRFDKLASTSNEVLSQILAEKSRRGEGSVESRFDAGVRATSSVSGTVQPAGRRSQVDFDPSTAGSLTPLPNPMPGLDGAEHEFGQESTRVMQDDVVQRLAERTRAQERQSAADEFNDEPTRARSAEEIDHLVRQSTGPISVAEEVLDKTNVDDRPRNKAPVISSSPPPPKAPSLPSVISTPELPVPDSAPIALGEDDPTNATALPRAAGATAVGDDTLREERPPTRKKSSPLPAILGVGVFAAAAIGYFVFAGSNPIDTPTPPAKSDTPTAKVDTPENGQKADEPKADEPKGEAKKADEPAPKIAEAPKGTSVEITSIPPGATVFVDGKERGTTPATVGELEPKKNVEVRVTLKGYRDFKTTLAPKAEGNKLEAKLVANEKVVEVSSTPPGADVFLDGKRVGRTPFTIRKLDVAKEHQLEARRGGFVAQVKKVAAGDAWETKPDGRDVLAVAMTLETDPKAAPRPVRPRPIKKNDGETPTATPPVGEKPPETGEKPPEKPPEEKPPVEKPVEKADKPPVEKPPAEKPPAVEKTDKPAADKPAAKPEGEAQ